MRSAPHFSLAATAAIALLLASAARAQIPNWPKVTPAEDTAAGIGVQLTGADYGNSTSVLATHFGGPVSRRTWRVGAEAPPPPCSRRIRGAGCPGPPSLRRFSQVLTAPRGRDAR